MKTRIVRVGFYHSMDDKYSFMQVTRSNGLINAYSLRNKSKTAYLMESIVSHRKPIVRISVGFVGVDYDLV